MEVMSIMLNEDSKRKGLGGLIFSIPSKSKPSSLRDLGSLLHRMGL